MAPIPTFGIFKIASRNNSTPRQTRTLSATPRRDINKSDRHFASNTHSEEILLLYTVLCRAIETYLGSQKGNPEKHAGILARRRSK